MNEIRECNFWLHVRNSIKKIIIADLLTAIKKMQTYTKITVLLPQKRNVV